MSSSTFAAPVVSLAGDYAEMPGGWLIHSSCIHDVEPNEQINDSQRPCPFPPRRVNTKSNSVTPVPVGYYSDWSVYAQYARPGAFLSRA